MAGIAPTLSRETKPTRARRWRAIFRARVACEVACTRCIFRRGYAAGAIVPTHCVTWPSADIAEQKALEDLARGLGDTLQFECVERVD